MVYNNAHINTIKDEPWQLMQSNFTLPLARSQFGCYVINVIKDTYVLKSDNKYAHWKMTTSHIDHINILHILVFWIIIGNQNAKM